jgi:glycosyltransferase involved in cell wall biosynthesis
MYRFTDFLSDINTNVSKLGTNEYITNKLFSKKKSIFIPNGITLTKKKNYLLNGNLNTNLKKEFNIPINHSIALAVGRFAKAKDYSNLINAIDKIVNRNKNFTLLIAGDGKLRKKIELQIQVLKLGNHIKLLGVRNDILYLMQNVDVFVMSSAWEGLPIVILEAASVGLPAVVTNVGGNKEVIENDKNGFIVPPKDSDELSKAIKKMIELPKTRRIEMGKYSRLKVKNIYEINKIVEKWLKIYNS